LQTIRHYDLPVKIFVFNNGCYGIIQAYQDTNLGGRHVGSGPDGYSTPDFMRLARGYHIALGYIDRDGNVKQRLAAILLEPGASIINVNMADQHAYAPRIFGWQTPIEDQYPYLDRAEFRANMLIEPWPGWETPAQPGGNHGHA
jgi:acetolactate synthase-1/2/3 large subunit